MQLRGYDEEARAAVILDMFEEELSAPLRRTSLYAIMGARFIYVLELKIFELLGIFAFATNMNILLMRKLGTYYN
ncbi:hypothetical protein ACS0TY_022763 [Phlomoides rotata]